MRNINDILQDSRIVDITRNTQNGDSIQVKLKLKASYNDKIAHVKFSRLLGWEHLSVAFEDEIPNWNYMQELKEMFWKDDEIVYQIHPKKSEYINNNEFCLHMWRNINEDVKTPPTILLGFREDHINEDRELLKQMQIELGSPITDCEIDLLLVNSIQDKKKMLEELEKLKNKYSPTELLMASLKFLK